MSDNQIIPSTLSSSHSLAIVGMEAQIQAMGHHRRRYVKGLWSADLVLKEEER
jgi:hypothetical protein